MAEQRPIIIQGGRLKRLPSGDTLPGGSGNQQVFYETPDPVGVSWPAINFVEGYFPARPTIVAMKVFKP